MFRDCKANQNCDTNRAGKTATRSLWGAGLLMLTALVGCASEPHSSPGAPAVTMLADPRVILDPAVVVLDHGGLDISGNVHRKPNWIGGLSGRVDVEFVGPDGEVLDGLPILIVPREIALGRASSFHASYGYVPPKGSVLRIHFVDSATMAQEDLEGGIFDAGVDAGAGGATGGTGGGGRPGVTANHYGTNHQISTSFGTHNFGPGGRR